MERKHVYGLCLLMEILCAVSAQISNQRSRFKEAITQWVSPADVIQEHLDRYIDITPVSDETILERDRALANELSNMINERKNILHILREEVRNQYDRRAPDVTYSHCCNVELPDASLMFPDPVNFNEWCIDGDILQESDTNPRFMPRDIMNLFKEQYEPFKNELRYIYYTTEEGAMMSYPGVGNCEPFEPRIRPWYVEAATPSSKDVIILVDISGSMLNDFEDKSYLFIAKEAAETVLDTLNPKDRVTIVAFNGQTYTPETIHGACFEQLLNVTAGNKRHLKNFLSGKGTGEGTSYLKALTKAFEIFQNTPTNDEDKDRFILMLTDGKPTDTNIDEIYSTIQHGNAALNNSVIIFTYGLGPEIAEAEEILEHIAKQDFGDEVGEVSPGKYTQVDDQDNLRFQMATFYDININDQNDEIRYLSPYSDAWDSVVNIPMCINIRHDFAIEGFICLDTAFYSFFGKVISYGNQDIASYAFVVDTQMRVMSHPLLSTPLESNDLVHVHITALETNLEPYIHNISTESSGEVTLSSKLVTSGGDVHREGIRTTIQSSSTYRWYALPDSSYILVTVNSNTHPATDVTWQGSYNSSCVYHNQHQECSDPYEQRFSQSSFMLSRNAFKTYEDYLMRDANINGICNHVNDRASPHVLKDGVKEAFAASDIINDLSLNHANILYYQLVTLAGVHRITPRLIIPDVYDPLEESWFKRCINANHDITISYPEDSPFGMSTGGISICRRIFRNSDKEDLFGVFNIVIKQDRLWDMLSDIFPQCISNQGCFLVSKSGYMILHSAWFTNAWQMPEMYRMQHLIQKEPEIANELIESNVMQKSICISIDAESKPRQYISWRLYIRRTLQRNGFDLHEIDSTNVILGIKHDFQNADDCTCSEANQVITCFDTSECFCPCYLSEVEWYNTCLGHFDFTDDSPSPCTPISTEYTFSNNECPTPPSPLASPTETTYVSTQTEYTTLSADEVNNDPEAQVKKSKEKSSEDWVIPVVVVLVLLLLVAVGVIVGVFIYHRRKTEDTYTDMVIPHNLQQTDYAYPAGTRVSDSPASQTSYISCKDQPIQNIKQHVLLDSARPIQPIAESHIHSLQNMPNERIVPNDQITPSKRDDFQSERSDPHAIEHLPSPCFQTDSPQKDADNLVSHYIWSLSEPNAQAVESKTQATNKTDEIHEGPVTGGRSGYLSFPSHTSASSQPPILMSIEEAGLKDTVV